MGIDAHEPKTGGTASAIPATTIRHDGWTGEKMAIFCETLAETAIVQDACDAAGMSASGAYAHRRRNPLFAVAWEAALTIARERLADTLLARSLEGNVEQVYRDGELVGERHVIDNKLGLAILRRLDRLAETGHAVLTPDGRAAAQARPGPRAGEGRALDWDLALDSLRTGSEEGIAASLAMLRPSKSYEVEEVDDPLNSLVARYRKAREEHPQCLSERCWRDESGEWMTDFPPPPGFDGYEKGHWRDYGYKRDCTAEEAEILHANEQAANAEEEEQDAAARDAWFALLREETAAESDPDGDESAIGSDNREGISAPELAARRPLP